MKPVYQLVTPELAVELLKGARQNNLMVKIKIERYKRLMLAGKWIDRLGTPIVVKGSELLDGRHRLTAIAETGKSYTLPFEYV